VAAPSKQARPQDRTNTSVRVEIFDQGYNLSGPDPQYIQKLAEYVDAKMRAVAEQTHTVDTIRVAVLAALNIADEYHLVKRNQDESAVEYLKRAETLSNALDEALQEQAKAG
jgi:cell division protein ZapA